MGACAGTLPPPRALAGPRGVREGRDGRGGGAPGGTRPPRATRYLPPDLEPRPARAASTDAPAPGTRRRRVEGPRCAAPWRTKTLRAPSHKPFPARAFCPLVIAG